MDPARPGGCRSCLHLTPELRRRAIEPARLGEQPISASRKICVSESCLRNWSAQAAHDNGDSSSSRLTNDDKRELAELRKRNAGWIENEILKRAAAYFAREGHPPKVVSR